MPADLRKCFLGINQARRIQTLDFIMHILDSHPKCLIIDLINDWKWFLLNKWPLVTIMFYFGKLWTLK